VTSLFRAKQDSAALDAFTRATELPLLILAIAMVPLIAVPLVVDLDAGVERAILAVDWMIWAIFALELGIRSYLAPARVSYLAHHWYDVVIVAIPFLRPLRIVRSARALRLLRGVRLVGFSGRIHATVLTVLTRHRLDYALASALTVVFASAALITRFERGTDSSLDDFGTALWWSAVTVTTVGYGDFSPTTAAGRGIAVLLMLLGIGLFSLVAANVAAFFVTEQEDEQNEILLSEIRALREKVDSLERVLVSGRASADESDH
jgi:voltage-gated potassium channel